MKITRKRNGFTLRCSDSEYQALVGLAAFGEVKPQLVGDAKRAYTMRTKGGNFLRVDVDKREARRAV